MKYTYGAHDGVESPLNGIAAISASVEGFLNSVRDFEIHNLKVFRVEGGEAVFAEFAASGTALDTGRQYHQN
jgi:hypothetical protein